MSSDEAGRQMQVSERVRRESAADRDDWRGNALMPTIQNGDLSLSGRNAERCGLAVAI